jgi:hypothetical protein
MRLTGLGRSTRLLAVVMQGTIGRRPIGVLRSASVAR